jgi:hypothetical protein
MGLDQYLNGRKFYGRYNDHPRTEDGFVIEEIQIALGYWRKHPNLHGYIVKEFNDGNDNCQDIELTAEQIKQIIEAVQEDKLPTTEGFFFGHSDGSEQQETLDILGRALGWLAFDLEKTDRAGMPWKSVVYRASW